MFPLDGMNKMGLVVADLMAGDQEETRQNTEKPDLTTTTAIRLLLDKAADVDEAIVLLGQYDMNASIGSAHRLSVADAGRERSGGVCERRDAGHRDKSGNESLSGRLRKAGRRFRAVPSSL